MASTVVRARFLWPFLPVFIACDGRGGPADLEPELGRSLIQVMSLGESDEVPFTDIRGIETDSGGRIWVAEWDSWFHVFNPDGTHIQSWARVGEGPGEFTYVAQMRVDPKTDRIAVREPHQTTVFQIGDDGLPRWSDPLLTSRMRANRVAFDPWGPGLMFSRVVRRDSVMEEGIRIVWRESILLRADAEGAVVDTVADLVGGWMRLREGFSSATRPATAGSEVWLPLGPDALLVGDGHREYELHVLAPSGDTVRTLSRPYRQEVIRGLDGPEFTVGFVQRATYDPSRREVLACRPQPPGRPRRDPVTVDYFRVSGEFIGSLEWPACPLHVNAVGLAYTVEYHELGMPLVRAYSQAEASAAVR